MLCRVARSAWWAQSLHLDSGTVSQKVGFALQFASQNCLGCYSKLNLGCKFHSEVATHLPHIKLRTLYTFNIIL